MSYPNYTSLELYSIGYLASSRIHNYNEFKNMFGFFFFGMDEKIVRSVFRLLFQSDFPKDMAEALKVKQ